MEEGPAAAGAVAGADWHTSTTTTTSFIQLNIGRILIWARSHCLLPMAVNAETGLNLQISHHQQSPKQHFAANTERDDDAQQGEASILSKQQSTCKHTHIHNNKLDHAFYTQVVRLLAMSNIKCVLFNIGMFPYLQSSHMHHTYSPKVNRTAMLLCNEAKINSGLKREEEWSLNSRGQSIQGNLERKDSAIQKGDTWVSNM